LERTRLRTRLVVLLVLMVLPFIIFSVYKAYDIAQSRRAERQQSNLALARAVAYSVDDYVESTEELLNAIAHSDVAMRMDDAALSAWFADLLENCGHYANVALFDTDGNLVASGRPAPHGKRINVSETSWFQRSMVSTELAVGEFAYSKIGGIPDVHLSLPVFDRQGARIGVVTAAMHLTRVQDRLMRERTPEHTTISVIDRGGTVIARNRDPEQWVGTDVGDVFQIDQMAMVGEGEGEATLGDGQRLICVFTEANQVPWFVRVGVDADYIASLVAKELGAHFAVFVPLLLVALGGWLWIGRDVDRLHKRMEALSLVDALTGLWNSRSLAEDMAQSVQQALRSGDKLAFAMLDLDDFKACNDRFGHVVGDQALQAAANAISAAIRGADRAYRYGGEEFCVLLPDADTEGAGAVAERVRVAVSEIELQPDPGEDPLTLTISIGVAVFPDDATSSDELMNCADTALYHAKRLGKNRIVVHCGRGV
jgi:diguanylate cyclase (GGDEF)-like protein